MCYLQTLQTLRHHNATCELGICRMYFTPPSCAHNAMTLLLLPTKVTHYSTKWLPQRPTVVLCAISTLLTLAKFRDRDDSTTKLKTTTHLLQRFLRRPCSQVLRNQFTVDHHRIFDDGQKLCKHLLKSFEFGHFLHLIFSLCRYSADVNNGGPPSYWPS